MQAKIRGVLEDVLYCMIAGCLQQKLGNPILFEAIEPPKFRRYTL